MLKEDKNAENYIFRPKNNIFDRFSLYKMSISRFHSAIHMVYSISPYHQCDDFKLDLTCDNSVIISFRKLF